MHPAGYKLSVGDEYYLRGRVRYLRGNEHVPYRRQDKWLEIPPFEVAIVKTGEILCLPRFLIGRWNIVVKHAYRGLLWVGGPQVDPGYVGHLFCPIYNLSDKEARLSHGDDLALMDFVKTTPYHYRHWTSNDRWIRQEYPPTRIIIEDYAEYGLNSALFTRAAVRIEKMEHNVEGLEHRFTVSIQFMFVALAVIPALLAAMVPLAGITLSYWGPVAIGFASFAAVAAVYNTVSNFVLGRLHHVGRRRPGWYESFHVISAVLGVVLALALAISLSRQQTARSRRTSVEQQRSCVWSLHGEPMWGGVQRSLGCFGQRWTLSKESRPRTRGRSLRSASGSGR